jgi:hypothetical protein
MPKTYVFTVDRGAFGDERTIVQIDQAISEARSAGAVLILSNGTRIMLDAISHYRAAEG